MTMFNTEQTWVFVAELILMFGIMLYIARGRLPVKNLQRLAGWYLKKALRAWYRMLNRIGEKSNVA